MRTQRRPVVRGRASACPASGDQQAAGRNLSALNRAPGGDMAKYRTVGSAALAAVAALVCVGCSSSTTPKPVGIGEAVNFSSTGGEKITMIVDKIADPADPAEGTQPPAGYRYVAVEFKVVNNGTGAYTDDPGSAKLIDGGGLSYSPTQVLPEVVTDMSAKDSESSDIPAGASAIDALVFQIPTAAKVATVQLVADHGAGQKGQWKAS